MSILTQLRDAFAQAGIDPGADEIKAAIGRLPLPQQHMVARETARESMAGYIEYMGMGITPAAHHRLLIGELEALERGEFDRLMVLMPPGSAKSSYGSVVFPAWYLGRNPEKSIIAASHTQDLIERFGRRARNLYANPLHKAVFGVSVAADRGAAGQWDTGKGGEYYAAGVGGAITGHRADCGLIDDPVKSREDADSDRQREKTWDWYINDYLTRLKPGSIQVHIQCMTGDTPVLMSDGTEKLLRYVRCGDEVATYEDGGISAAKILNWKSQGHDLTYEIMTTSGITVRANERHPFLVAKGGELKWVQLRELTVGTEIVRVICRVECGRELSAEKLVAESQLSARGSACRTITNADGMPVSDRHLLIRHLAEMPTLNTVMASSPASFSGWSRLRAVDAPFAESLQEKMCVLIGAESFASITATRQERLGDCSATIVTSSSDTGKQSRFCSPPLDMFEIIHDKIISIEPFALEEVFDIQVERTENFIANGLVSHNTRWHEEDDLAGRILQMEPDRWRVLKLPMEAGINDPLGRKVGERLWPEWFTAEMMADAKRDPRAWNALYQQEPAGEDGDYFKRDWFREIPPHENVPPLSALSIYGASDYAVTEGSGDFTEHGIFGVDAQSNVYMMDWWRDQAPPDVWIEAKCDLIIKHKPLCWFGESGPIRRSIEPFLLKRMTERQATCRIEWLPSIHDKATRCRSFQALCSMGKVFLPPRFPPWKADVVGQLLRFPAGLHDDAVDVCSLIGRGLEHVRVPDRGILGSWRAADALQCRVRER